jgi:preprotein translocase subunit SecE
MEEKVGIIGKTRGYVHEVQGEMRKVTWPTRGELYGATAVVFAVTVILCAYLGVLDFLLGQILEFFLTFGKA